MKYKNIIEGNFINRPNRFIAEVMIGGKVELAHVKNTGRCKEILTPQTTVYLEDFEGRMGMRKMRYSLIAVKKGEMMINMDSQAPNKVVQEGLQTETIKLNGMKTLKKIRPETVYGNSRFDFYICDEDGQEGYIEVKGVTLEENGIAAFPDAPTERGVKHIKELIAAASAGYKAYIIFVVQMKGMKYFVPNDRTDPAFGKTLREAAQNGVEVMALQCDVTPDSIEVSDSLKIKL